MAAKIRDFSEAETFYVQNNLDKTDAELASIMPGIGPKTVAKFRQSLPEPEVTELEPEPENETPENRVIRLSQGPTVGKMMAHRDGMTIMTEGASQVSDARQTVRGRKMSKADFVKTNRTRIHTIDPSKPIS